MQAFTFPAYSDDGCGNFAFVRSFGVRFRFFRWHVFITWSKTFVHGGR